MKSLLSKIYKYTYLKKYIPEPFFSITKFIYHYLRYLNLIKINYSLKPKIHFEKIISNKYFKNKLIKSNCYLEYGSGNSTLYCDKNYINYYSIEGDKNFYSYLKEVIKKKKRLKFVSLGITEFASQPIFFNLLKRFYKIKALNYAQSTLSWLINKKIYPDLILIDGRFRVLCGLCIHQILFYKKNKITVIIDDYRNREYYHILNKFYFIKLIGNFAILTIKKNNLNIDYYIEKFSRDCR